MLNSNVGKLCHILRGQCVKYCSIYNKKELISQNYIFNFIVFVLTCAQSTAGGKAHP